MWKGKDQGPLVFEKRRTALLRQGGWYFFWGEGGCRKWALGIFLEKKKGGWVVEKRGKCLGHFIVSKKKERRDGFIDKEEGRQCKQNKGESELFFFPFFVVLVKRRECLSHWSMIIYKWKGWAVKKPLPQITFYLYFFSNPWMKLCPEIDMVNCCLSLKLLHEWSTHLFIFNIS